jgi:tRNA/rRNA methyltransferase
VLAGARRYDTLDAALADRRRVYATAALPKSLPQPVITPRGLGPALRADTSAGHDAAVVFGTERTGLSYDDLARADVLVRVPTDPACRALNLAQAAALCAWEWCAAGDPGASGAGGFPPPATPPGPVPATREAVDGLVRHVERALDAAERMQEPALRARLLRSLRVAFGRGLTDAEVNTLRGVVSALTRGGRG